MGFKAGKLRKLIFISVYMQKHRAGINPKVYLRRINTI